MERSQSWKVRDGNEKDLEGILALRSVVFGEVERDRLEPRFWQWEFMEGPDGKAFIYIVEEGKRVIGHFADVPRRFSVNGKMVLGTLSLDLMVHPDYRRMGIFSEMGRYAAERVKAQNGFFMTAYPIRPETIDGFKKIGWQIVAELPVLIYPIQFRGIMKRYLRFPPLNLLIGGMARLVYFLLFGIRGRLKGRGEGKGSEIEEVLRLDDQFDRFWQKALPLHPMMGVRDQIFLTWRYLRHPTRTYTIYRAMKDGEMKGYIVLRKVGLLKFNSAVVVDLLALDEEVLKALVRKGIEHGRKEGVDLLGFMVPKLHPYYRALSHHGFLPSLKTFLFMICPHAEEEMLLNPEGWYVNWGDTDVI